MHIYKIFTLFPELIESYIKSNAPIKRGIANKIIEVIAINFRDYAKDKHKKVDAPLYGGGPGLLLKTDVLLEAIEKNTTSRTQIFLMDPKGEKYTQSLAKELSLYDDIALVCGRYEGFDARLKPLLNARSINVGDFILTGGELPALTVLDSSVRLLKGTCDNNESTINESFSDGLLEADQYTRPYEVRGKQVPSVLLSGNHKEIEKWKRKNSIKNSIKSRPDIFKNLNLDNLDLNELREAIKEIYYGDEHRSNS